MEYWLSGSAEDWQRSREKIGRRAKGPAGAEQGWGFLLRAGADLWQTGQGAAALADEVRAQGGVLAIELSPDAADVGPEDGALRPAWQAQAERLIMDARPQYAVLSDDWTRAEACGTPAQRRAARVRAAQGYRAVRQMVQTQGVARFGCLLHEFVEGRDERRRSAADAVEGAEIVFLDHPCRNPRTGMDAARNAANGARLRALTGNRIEVVEILFGASEESGLLGASPAESRMWFQEAAAGGMTPGIALNGPAAQDPRYERALRGEMAWYGQNIGLLREREQEARVGILRSAENRDLCADEDAWEICGLPAFGMRHACMKARIPFVEIEPGRAAEWVGRGRVLAVPDAAALDVRDVTALMAHLDAGGGLLLTGRAAMLDAEGNPTQDLRLWQRLGLTPRAEWVGADFKEHHTPQMNSYLLKQCEHPVLEGFEQTDVIAFGGRLQRADSDGTLAQLTGWVPGIPISPCEISYIQDVRPEVGSLFAGELPGGGRVVCMLADIDRLYGRDQIPDHGMLIQNALNWCARGEWQVRLSGPGDFDVRMYRQPGRRIVHVVNITGSNPVGGYIEESLPMGPVTLEVAGAQNVRARRLVSGGDCAAQPIPSGVRVTLERVVGHEVLVLEECGEASK